ncbi:MAG: GNAT family N-acetyltransferase [Actinomycetota bacterium]
MDDVVIDLAGPDDVDDLAALRVRWITGATTAEADFIETFRRWWSLEQPQRVFWIARRAGSPVGMVNLTMAHRMPSPTEHDRGAWAYLGNMFVVEYERDQGVGRRLLDSVIAHAEAAGVARILLRPSERARPFYERADFAPADDDVVMRHSS